MKKTIVKIIGITIAIILMLQQLHVYAVLEQDKLKQEQSANEDKIQEMQQKADELEEKKSETMKAVEALIPKISNAETELDNLKTKISNLQTQIETKEKDIQEKEKEYTKLEELIDTRLLAMYQEGKTSYLEILLTASSITDFLAKYYAASELIECDKEIIQETKNQKAQIEKEKAELEANKKELDSSLVEQKQKVKDLEGLKNEKQSYANKLSSEEKQLEKEIEELERANKKIQKEIKEAEERYRKQLEELEKQESQKPKPGSGGGSSGSSGESGGSGSSGGSGYLIKPVSGGRVTANGYYSTGKFHGAIDYGIPVGNTVMAAADGVVMSTDNLTDSYGTYVVIRHANGLQTYYGHGVRGSICVKPGQIVKQGQKIMLSGNTGNSSGPHLHFEVRVAPYNYSYSAKAYGQDSRRDPNKYM